MKTIIFTNARNEDNILEWVVHHLNLGFDHVYVIDHKSNDPIEHKLQIIPNNLCSIERIEGDIMKNKLIFDAHKYAIKNEYDWMLYLDADEFLVLNDDDNVKDLLNKYDSYDQVGLNWLMFGSNNLKNKPSDTVLSSYIKSMEYLDHHIKSFLHLKRENTKYMIPQPHVYYLDDMSKSVTSLKVKLNSEHTYWFDTGKKFNEIPGFIAHYVFQSYETYLERKISVPRDDSGLFRDIIPEIDFHLQYNDFDNFSVRDKYNEKNKQKINEYKNLFEQMPQEKRIMSQHFQTTEINIKKVNKTFFNCDVIQDFLKNKKVDNKISDLIVRLNKQNKLSKLNKLNKQNKQINEEQNETKEIEHNMKAPVQQQIIRQTKKQKKINKMRIICNNINNNTINNL